MSAAQVYFNSQTSANTRIEPEWPNLVLVSLEHNDNFKNKSDTDESDTDLETNSIYGMDFGKFPKE